MTIVGIRMISMASRYMVFVLVEVAHVLVQPQLVTTSMAE